MDAKRWTSIWTFAAGCLSGAAIIGWRLGEGSSPLPPPTSDLPSASGHAALRSLAASLPEPSSSLTESPAGAHPVADSAARAPSKDSREPVAEVRAGTEPPAEGRSVADVLARLEAEYREQEGGARDRKQKVAVEAVAGEHRVSAPEPKLAVDSKKDERVEKASPTDAPGIVAAALPVAPPDSVVGLPSPAAPPAAAEPAPPAPSTQPVLVTLAAPDLKALVDDSGQQRLSAELRSVAALQQATIAQQAALAQQFAVLQYLQLVSLSSNPAFATPTHAPPRRSAGGRIVDTLPATFSASDNPWGFNYPAPVLLR